MENTLTSSCSAQRRINRTPLPSRAVTPPMRTRLPWKPSPTSSTRTARRKPSPTLPPRPLGERIANEIRMQFRREKKTGSTVSLQESLDTSKDDSALTLSDLLQDTACMEENLEKKADAQRLRLLIEALPARERQLVLLRYGLAGQPPLTQLETAQLLGISRSYVSRLESHALDLLRRNWKN